MAALHTFEWLVQQLWPNPDEETKKELDRKRDRLLKIRNENERLRFVEEIMREAREMRKRKSAHA
ncbi:MAG: hypothetical protein A2059_00230 [Ignavibacteria bacterium GWA2_55_25]|nr:hypothetical protein [Ignavibacteriales bacterium]OGU19006.1 MAG: hypothetical protein A2059_00230 [Ignavibacteria bacterium GWA2_55_25]